MLNFIHLGTDHWCCLSEKSAWQNLRNTVKKQPREQVGGWSFVLLGATWQPNNAYSPQFVKEYTLTWEPLIKLDLPHMKENWRREQWTIHYSTQDPHSWNRFVFTSNLLSHYLRKYKWVILVGSILRKLDHIETFVANWDGRGLKEHISMDLKSRKKMYEQSIESTSSSHN